MEPISVTDLKKEIDNLKKSNKALVWFTILMSLIIASILLLNRTIPVEYDAKIKALEDSIAATHIRDSITIDAIRYRGIRDSMTIATTRTDLLATAVKMNQITKKYDTKREHISNLVADEQFVLFTEWISQTDSL